MRLPDARSAADLVTLTRRRVSEAGVPRGRTVTIGPGRQAHIWECEGPPGAACLVLLHGLVATGGLNWFPAMTPLSERFRVIAIDLRGHGRSTPVADRFRLADCADDVAEVIQALDVGPALVCGYSLGGPVAQLVWHRHRDLVAGLILCATSRNIGGSMPEKVFFRALLGGLVGLRAAEAVAQLRPGRTGSDIDSSRPPAEGDSGAGPAEALDGETLDPTVTSWALSELRRSDPRTVVAAVAMMGRFSSHGWVETIDVPTAVVVTEKDHLISTTRQLKLARAIPGATVHPVAAGHAACVIGARWFVPALVEAAGSVADRLGYI
jgi:3-oxoadipate enol-lactonase